MKAVKAAIRPAAEHRESWYKECGRASLHLRNAQAELAPAVGRRTVAQGCCMVQEDAQALKESGECPAAKKGGELVWAVCQSGPLSEER